MAHLTRRQINRIETIQEIKDVARAVMTEVGTSGLTLRGIAARMNIAVSALYRYYANRDDLITALILDANDNLGAALRAADAQHPRTDFTARLQATALAYRAWALEHATEFQLIFGNPIPGYVAPAEQTQPAARNAGMVLDRVVMEAIEAGFYVLPPEFTETDSPLNEHFARIAGGAGRSAAPIIHVFLVLWSMVHGMTILEVHHHVDALLGEYSEEFFRRNLIGLMKRIGWPAENPP